MFLCVFCHLKHWFIWVSVFRAISSHICRIFLHWGKIIISIFTVIRKLYRVEFSSIYHKSIVNMRDFFGSVPYLCKVMGAICICCCSSQSQSRGQQSKQRCQTSTSPSHLLQLFLWDTEILLCHPSDTISGVSCVRPGASPQQDMSEAPYIEASGKHSGQMPEPS